MVSGGEIYDCIGQWLAFPLERQAGKASEKRIWSRARESGSEKEENPIRTTAEVYCYF